MKRVLKSGKGWQLGWDPSAPEYKGLVGGENWAIELTEAEIKDFCRLLAQLAAMMAHMAAELMDEEHICCETESELLWLEADGFPSAYSIRLILNQGRRGEGAWQTQVVPDLLAASQMLGVF